MPRARTTHTGYINTRLTAYKWYKITDISKPSQTYGRSFTIPGIGAHCLEKGCAHLGGGSWEIDIENNLNDCEKLGDSK